MQICNGWPQANELARLIRKREVSAKEVLEAHLAQIERVNPKVNAICTLAADRARETAGRCDRALSRGEAVGALHGIPIAIKDLALTKGIRTTFGSPIFKDFVPDEDELFVERLEAAGAVILGKTNTPEFGAGSQTYNEVFGETRNPYDLTKTCGGSSGGAAVALACGMVPLADGSDLGGSLRNPASFCNVVGLRPSPGRVPRWPSTHPWESLGVTGPMARNVRDAALLLSVMAGPDPRDPLSIPRSPSDFAGSLDRDFKDARIAFSHDLGNLPVEPVVAETCRKSLGAFTDLGVVVEEACPDFEGAHEAFNVLRAFLYVSSQSENLKSHRHLLKDTVIWNTEQGLKLTASDIARAEAKRAVLYRRMREFLERYDFFACPVSQVAPFDIETRWPREVNGAPMRSYIEWMASCYYITLSGHPAISVPCGFTPEGLPIGLQIVGRHRDEQAVLQLAHAFEQSSRAGDRRPEVAS